jgi:hypothetical protein
MASLVAKRYIWGFFCKSERIARIAYKGRECTERQERRDCLRNACAGRPNSISSDILIAHINGSMVGVLADSEAAVNSPTLARPKRCKNSSVVAKRSRPCTTIQPKQQPPGQCSGGPKAISYQSMLQDLEHRLRTYAHSLVDGHLQREYDLQLSKWKIYINRVAGAYGQAFKRHESTLQAAKAKQKADSDMVMLAFSFVGFLSMARPSGRCPTGATSPFSLDAQLDTVLRKAAGNNERFIILPPPPASVPLAPAMRLRKSEFLASNSWKSPAGLGATRRSTRRTQLDQENPDEFVSRRRRHSAPVNESTSEPLRRWRPSHPPGTRPERKPCPVHRAHHSFVSQKNTSHV